MMWWRLVAECIAQLCFHDFRRLDLGAATGADQQVRLDGPPLRRPQGPVEVEVDALQHVLASHRGGTALPCHCPCLPPADTASPKGSRGSCSQYARSAWRKNRRPRDSRDMTVPIGRWAISAISR